MVYIFLADGFEETEAVVPVDILRRAGLDVRTAGISGKTVTGSHGIEIVCDCQAADIEPDKSLQAVVLPGGMPGAKNLENSAKVGEFIDFAYRNGLLLCAICAAPFILGHRGLLKNKKAVCYRGFEKELTGAMLQNTPVCTDGNIITAKGMGSAVVFALEIVRYLCGEQKASAIGESLQCPKTCRT